MLDINKCVNNIAVRPAYILLVVGSEKEHCTAVLSKYLALYFKQLGLLCDFTVTLENDTTGFDVNKFDLIFTTRRGCGLKWLRKGKHFILLNSRINPPQSRVLRTYLSCNRVKKEMIVRNLHIEGSISLKMTTFELMGAILKHVFCLYYSPGCFEEVMARWRDNNNDIPDILLGLPIIPIMEEHTQIIEVSYCLGDDRTVKTIKLPFINYGVELPSQLSLAQLPTYITRDYSSPFSLPLQGYLDEPVFRVSTTYSHNDYSDVLLTRGGKSFDERVDIEKLKAITQQNIGIEGMPLFEVFPSNRQKVVVDKKDEEDITIEVPLEVFNKILPLCSRENREDEVENCENAARAANFFLRSHLSDSQFYNPKPDEFPFLNFGNQE